jgi:hypothetical protein
MDQQLRDLMAAAAGDPPQRLTAESIRRKVIRRRVTSGACAAAAVLVIAGIAAAVSAHVGGLPGFGPVSRSVPHGGEPGYYLEENFTANGSPHAVIRATYTGRVTAVLRSPWRQGELTSDMIPLTHRAYLVVCEQVTGRGLRSAVLASRIYRFQLSSSGRVTGYALMRGGVLNGWRIEGIAAVPSGTEVAATVVPGGSPPSSDASQEVLVINTRTGAQAAWLSGTAAPGTVSYGVGDMSLTSNGRELVLLGSPRCVKDAKHRSCPGAQQEVLALSPAARGGSLTSARVLIRQSQITSPATGYINDAMVTPNGSKVTLAVVGGARISDVSVVQASAATGKKLRVLYRMKTGDGFLYRFFSADPTGRYLLLGAGPTSGAADGWIYHHTLIRLRPDNSDVFLEVW